MLLNTSVAYLHTTAIKKWDICAADALITISGGIVTDLNGDPIGYSNPREYLNQNGLLLTNEYANSFTSNNKILSHKFLLKSFESHNQH